MGYVEFRIHIAYQRMAAVDHLVTKYAPFFADALFAFLPITKIEDCVSGETGAKRRGDLLVSPVGNLDQRLPENFLRQIRADDIGTGNDQCVQSLRLDLVEALVMFIDMLACSSITRQRIQCKRMHIKLGDRVTFSYQPQELSFGGFECCIRHHVQKPDMQLTNILLTRELRTEHA